MSGRLAGAVLRHGPRGDMSRWALVTLALNADEFGFAAMTVETLARSLDREAKQAGRYLRSLRENGWIAPLRKAVEGCGNVYFLNLRKLGFETGAKATKDRLHAELEALAGERWAPPTFAQPAVQKPLLTTDFPQGGQRTFGGGAPDIWRGDTGHLGLPNKDALFPCSLVSLGGSTHDDGGEEENFQSASREAPAALPALSVDVAFPSGVWRPPERGPRRQHRPLTCRRRPSG